MSGGGNSFQNETSSGVSGNDAFDTSGPSFGNTIIGGGGFSVSTPVMIGAAVLALAGLYFWGKK